MSPPLEYPFLGYHSIDSIVKFKTKILAHTYFRVNTYLEKNTIAYFLTFPFV
jgi:hypothetical protein